MSAEPKSISIYTDGACSGNPGRGGYGVVILEGGQRRELSGGFRLTTNNRMELLAAIVGLGALSDMNARVTLYSDSRYVVDMFNGGYARQWRSAGWKRNRGKEPVKNPDLWQDLLDIASRHEVEMVWVRGHASNRENARCDEMAVEARLKDDLPADEGYVNPAPVAPLKVERDLFGVVV